jgi:hypothetical protein
MDRRNDLKKYMWMDKNGNVFLTFNEDTNVLSRDRVTIDGVWIGNWNYCTLETHNYN